MPSKRKKFIDKKNSVTFRLVHRSQKDPLAADETAPKHVLLDCGKLDDVEAKKRKKEEQQKYGIYYDDDYNYLQHLRDVKTISEWEPVADRRHPEVDNVESDMEKPMLNLPSSVFQSHVEESEGLLNKAATVKGPRPDWDPDIVAALDDDFDFQNIDNELEDDFIALANQPKGTPDGTWDSDDDTCEEDSDGSYCEGSEDTFGSEETKTRFTNYSMSSSVLPRSENLQDIDDHFEKFFEKYDDEEIGALDMDDIQGYLKPDSEIVQQLAEEFAGNQEKMTLKGVIMSNHSLQALEMTEYSDEELLDITVQEKGTERWDCESIISTYSTTNNRPQLIEEIRKDKKIEISTKSGLPRDTLKTKGLTDHMLKMLNKESTSISEGNKSVSQITMASTLRPKNETSIEKKERKAAIKQIRKERRSEKKANKLAFKEEEKHQEKVMLNLKNNLNGIKLL